jgi:hypothetical protein
LRIPAACHGLRRARLSHRWGWQTREQFDRFVEERLMPIVRDIAPSDARQPELAVYELRGFVVAPQAAEVRGF